MNLNKNNMILWYKQPATSWEEALSIGNGRLGAMVFGGIEKERIQLNEDTLWSGYPKDTNNSETAKYIREVRKLIFEEEYVKAQRIIEETMLGPYNESYLPLGNLYIELEGINNISDYRRELDIETAIAKTIFSDGEKHFTRKIFSSAVDLVIVIRLSCNKEKELNIKTWINSDLKYNTYIDEELNLIMKGRCPSHVEPNYVYNCLNPIIYDEEENNRAIRFEAQIKVINNGGTRLIKDNEICVKGADSIVLIIAAATNFNGYNNMPETDGKNPSALCKEYLNKAIKKDYNKLQQDHMEDYKKLFNRVDISLGSTGNEEMPKDT